MHRFVVIASIALMSLFTNGMFAQGQSPPSIKPIESLTDDEKRRLQIYKESFPWMNMGISQSGAIVGTPHPKPRTAQPVRKNSDPDSLLLQDFRAALSSEERAKERYTLAIRLRQTAQDVAIRRRPRYQHVADEEFHVPTLVRQVRLLLEAERRSPYNPGTGAHSYQTVSALEQLHVARTRANQHVQEVAKLDVEVMTALIAAEAEIRLFEAGVQAR